MDDDLDDVYEPEETRALLARHVARWLDDTTRHTPELLSRWITRIVFEPLPSLDDDVPPSPRVPQRLTWEAFETFHAEQLSEFHKLWRSVGVHAMGSECRQTLKQLQLALQTSRDFLMQCFRLAVNRAPNNLSDHVDLLHPRLRDLRTRELDNETLFDSNMDKLTTFQKCIIRLTYLLETCQFRRARGFFFESITTATGFATLAFRPATSIQDFVAANAQEGVDFNLWKWMSDPSSNFLHVVEYLKTRPLIAAPDLKENLHLRSYEGDAVGRGAGIYDCNHDVFYPFVHRHEWHAYARRAQSVRRITTRNSSLEVTPPNPKSDVCTVHLYCTFPYDTDTEHRELLRHKVLGALWREAEEHECDDARFEIHSPALSEFLSRSLERGAMCEQQVGRLWQDAAAEPPSDWKPLDDEDACRTLRALVEANRELVLPIAPKALDASTFLRIDDDHFLVPLVEPPYRAYTLLPPDLLNALVSMFPSRRPGVPGVDPRAFVRGVDGRFFRMWLGRTWSDCEISEIDHIFDCQRFDVHDRFGIHAGLGKLYFKVKEKDKQETTFGMFGVGGSGKSTVVKAMMHFWPSHLCAILSSNMQRQFGMGSIAHGAVAFCSEIADELNIPQEEWQQANSGEVMSLAVKFKEPILIDPWTAPFFWAGNFAPPRNYNNDQGQVSRRLYAVGMYHKVRPRDGGIADRIKKKLGHLQRRNVLAYDDFVLRMGHLDIMSVPDRLPCAFADFYDRTVRQVDPMCNFLGDGAYVVCDEGGAMLLDDFKMLFETYKQREDVPKQKGRWDLDNFRSTFIDFGIVCSKQARWTDPVTKQEYHDVKVVSGVRPA